MTAVSIIIPLYNAEQYIRPCLESVMTQSFADFEVIVVNDGSTDLSPDIARQMAERDSRIKVFDKQNEGVSIARNCGINRASGQWLMFLDADDELLPDAVATLVANAGQTDIVFSRYEHFDRSATEGELPVGEYSEGTMKDALKGKMQYMGMCVVWAKLFRAGIVRDKGIAFDARLRFAEDTVFVHSYLSHCASATFVKDKTYRYRHQAGDGFLAKYSMGVANTLYLIDQTQQAYDKVCHRFGFTDDSYIQKNVHVFFMTMFLGQEKTLRDTFPYTQADAFFSNRTVQSMIAFRRHFSRGNQLLYFCVQHRLYSIARLVCMIKKNHL